jgi:hypothetical protein
MAANERWKDFALWTVQALLALVFLLAGGVRLVLPEALLTITDVSLSTGAVGAALIPFVAGALTALVAYER